MTARGTTPATDHVRRFLDTKSVAIVGASERQHHTRALISCLELGGIGPDQIALVSSSNDVVHGRRTVASLRDLESRPDLVFSLVPARYVAAVLRDTAAIGAHAFVSIADGFADAGDEGRVLQAELIAIADEHDIALLGPNTLGFLAPGFGVGAWVGDWSSITVPPLAAGPIAIVAQSSGILNLVLQLSAQRRIGIRAAVSVGNEAVVDAAQFVQAFADDAETSVIGVVLESTTRPRALADALTAARQRGKRVFIFKFGSSEIGRRNALSHSGRLASEGRVWDALFAKLGIGVASDFDEFVDGLALIAQFERSRYAGDGDLGFLTVSGGDVGLVSDLCEKIGVPLASFTHATEAALLAVEGNTTHAASNPLDLGLIGHRVAVLDGIAECVVADPGIGFLAARLALPWRFSERAAEIYDAIHQRASAANKPFIVITRAAEPLDSAWYEYCAVRGVPLVTAYGSGLRTLRAVLDLYDRTDHSAEWAPTAMPATVTPRVADAPLSWQATQDLLSEWGVPHVAAAVATSAAEAPQVAARIGYPLCVKGIVPGVVHKSDAGLVRLDIADDSELVLACEAIAAQPVAAESREPIVFELQKMVPISLELLIGMVRDPIMGPVLTFGAGGTGVEKLHDVRCLLPPVTDGEVEEAMARLAIGAELLDDSRCSPEQRMGFVRLLRAFADGVVAAGDAIGQVDVNPVVFTTTGDVVAVDAVVMADATKGVIT